MLAASCVFANDDAIWRPVTPAEMQMKTPQVEPDADAEAIFWEVRVDDKKANHVSYLTYVRVKIFTEHGREKFSKLDIPYIKNRKIEDIAARVIKPDGTIVNMNPNDVFEREIVKVGKLKVKAKSFALPGVETGVIVEYQYRESIKNDSASHEKLVFQRDIPMQRVAYYVRPAKDIVLNSRYYNMAETRFVEDPTNKGYYVAAMENVPAYKQEPYMPPEDEVRRWAYLYYSSRFFGPTNTLHSISTTYRSLLMAMTKSTKTLKQKAAEITANATTDEDKLRRIYDYAQQSIKNLDYDSSVDAETLEDFKPDSFDDLVKSGMARSLAIDWLFGFLARAAGYEVGVVFAGNRNELFFTREKYPFSWFVEPSGVAVRVNEKWRFFNPGKPYLPFEALPWNGEAVSAMVVFDGGYTWTQTPLTDHTRSVAKRYAKLKLGDDGVLEGTMRVEYFGQTAIERRANDINSSLAKREDLIRAAIKSRLNSAEVSELKIENIKEHSKPLLYTYKVRIPDYAQKTGKRMFFQPGFFEYGSQPVFPASARTHDIYFPYPLSEEDDITIDLPAGFDLDNAESPAELFDPEKIGGLKVTISIDRAANRIFYRRKFYFGANRNIIFPKSAYPAIKNMFDAFHKADTHVITLKQKQ